MIPSIDYLIKGTWDNSLNGTSTTSSDETHTTSETEIYKIFASTISTEDSIVSMSSSIDEIEPFRTQSSHLGAQ